MDSIQMFWEISRSTERHFFILFFFLNQATSRFYGKSSAVCLFYCTQEFWASFIVLQHSSFWDLAALIESTTLAAKYFLSQSIYSFSFFKKSFLPVFFWFIFLVRSWRNKGKKITPSGLIFLWNFERMEAFIDAFRICNARDPNRKTSEI